MYTDLIQTVGSIPDPRLPYGPIFTARSVANADLLALTIHQGAHILPAAIKACFANITLFDTKCHRDVISNVGNMAVKLTRNQFVGQQGTSCITLVGAKGIGKSFCLRACAMAIPRLLPNLLTVVINFESVDDALSAVLTQELNNEGVPPIPEVTRRGQQNEAFQIVKRLEVNSVSLLVLIDEFQMLYTKDGNKNPLAVQTLKDLAFFGSQNSGRVSIILCGSVTYLAGLVTKTIDPREPLYGGYPLLTTGGFGLNGTKFTPTTIRSPLPTDLEAVSAIADRSLVTGPLVNAEANRQWVRLTAFVTGCNIREIQKAMNQNPCDMSIPEPSSPIETSHAFSVIEKMRNNLNMKLVVKNEKLWTALLGDTPLQTINNVKTSPWEDHFRPLTLKEVREVFQKMLLNGEIGMVDEHRFHDFLMHIYDRGWAILDWRWGNLQYYPPTLYSLLAFRTGIAAMPDFAKQAAFAISQAPVAVVGNQRVITAVVSITERAAVTACAIM